ncbi:hypothetical protein HMN09_01176100 [Mycena chlorophos]|uniref:DUF6534 domain-containing protein n=1 Tax=Mycena chlorophos TaxID=658473 RepID=A0A8H6S6P0_MYCCL|nr:hypothetical protein HMN09_01176100 [Mycena chlorophos]
MSAPANATAAAAAAAAAAEEAAAILAAFNPNPTIGALLVGALVSCVLWGISTTQTYIYFSRFPEDSLAIKLLVSVVWLFEFGHTICTSHVVYIFAITNYGNPLVLLGKTPPTLGLTVLLGTLTTCCVQGFFAFRIWTLAPHPIFKAIPIALWISLFAYLGFTTADTALSIINPIPVFDTKYHWLLLVPTAMNVVNDNSITICLVLLLLWTRQKKGFRNTVLLLDQLLKWTLETGMLTSIFSCLNLAFYVQQPDNFIWIALQVVRARVFANSLLASLNSRDALRTMSTQKTGNTWGASTNGHTATSANISFRGQQVASGFGGGRGANAAGESGLNIQMTKVTLEERDSDPEVMPMEGKYGYEK